MFEQAKTIQRDSFFHITNEWNDPDQMTIGEYAEILNDSVFVLCPAGNISMDTFRFYEALEAGAIPIVENRNIYMILREIANNIFKSELGVRLYMKRCYPLFLQVNYWRRAYGSGFPIPVIYDWRNLKSLISKIDIEETSKRSQYWWKNYKETLTKLVTETIDNKFYIATEKC